MLPSAAAETREPAQLLLGRVGEQEVIRQLIDAAREGHGGTLVLHGPPGVGKTALLRHAISSADGFRVARTVGIEGEMALPFGALQQLCAPMSAHIEELPNPQRRALEVAFGVSTGETPDRFLVGLAVLNLLSEEAASQPLLCVVDDAQWLDSASSAALAFVARRLLAERLAVIFAAREPGVELAGIERLPVDGLRDRDARALLMSAIPDRLDERVRERIIAEMHGNPLALLELPRGLTPAQLAGGFGLPDAVPLPGRIEDSYQRRLAKLPVQTRRLLLLAAAEPLGDPRLLWLAAERLGVPDSAATSAESEGFLDFGTRVTFRHPLVRSAVYRSASPEQTRGAHRTIAEVTDPAVDPDRRAWHRAQGSARPNEEIAEELERSAGRAQARGGLAAAAAFMQRSAELTLDPARRARRALDAATAKHQAGALDAALSLVTFAETGPMNDLEEARADVLRAQISFSFDRGGGAFQGLLDAAQRLDAVDPVTAREIYLDALSAALFAGRFGYGRGAVRVAQAARTAPGPPRAPRASDILLDGLALQITTGPAAAAPVLSQAVTAFRDGDLAAEQELRWLWIAGRAAGFTWDYDSWDELSARQVRLAREAGALTVLPVALDTRVGVHVFAGELARAAALVDEIAAVNEAIDNHLEPYGELALAAFQGREEEATRVITRRMDDFLARSEGLGVTLAHWATAALHNGLAHYQQALSAAELAATDPRELWFSGWSLVELIEAAARSGDLDRATEALALLADTTQASATGWGLSLEARSRALVSHGTEAEALYREAIDRLAATRLGIDRARARLLYGEWLRRERRRLDAREQLRIAHEQFTQFGAEAFAERARIELRATGERARKRVVETVDNLTPQEAQIARLAAEGSTNQEIAAQLFISPSTVEYHLRKTFRKLGLRSRTQLARHVLQTGSITTVLDD